MSSGGWEVVGKNKKNKSQPGQPAKLHKSSTQSINNGPNIEDVLPLNQVKSLYNFDGNKANKKPKENDQKSQENEKKKQQKQKQKNQQTEKKKAVAAKPKAFKTLDEAAKAISKEEVYGILETNQKRFPDTPWVWLEDLATFLNEKLMVEKNPIYPVNPKDSLSWPLCAIPRPILSILEKAIEMTEKSQARWFHKQCYIKFSKDTADGARPQLYGYKIFFQLLIKKNLEMSLEEEELPQVCTPQMFWALLQYGLKDLGTGLRVWQKKLSPMLNNPQFSKLSAQVLNYLILCHENSQKLGVDLDLILDLWNTAYSKGRVPLTIESSIEKSLDVSMRKLRNMYLKSETKNLPKIFETVMSKLLPKSDWKYNTELTEILVGCLESAECHSKWKSLYLKHLYPSSLLLASLKESNNYKKYENVKTFKDTLIYLDGINKKQLKSNDQKGKNSKLIATCNEACEAILKKMTMSSQSRFPWRKGSILLLLLIGGILAFDYQKHGSFKASSTGKFMENSGINVYVQRLWNNAKVFLFKAPEIIEASSPDYYRATVNFFAPYVKLAGDLCLITRNISVKWYNETAAYVEKNGPVLRQTIDHYAPGMINEIQVRSIQGLELAKTYSNIAAEKIVQHTTTATTWLQSNVFVGKLSPENLQNYASRAIDTTQAYASQTYDWVYEKIQTLSKLP